MKYTDWRAFERHLQSAQPDHLSPLYLILSKEEFPRLLAEETICTILEKKDQTLLKYDGQTVNIEQIEQILFGMDFFAEEKILYINSCDKLPKKIMECISSYLTHPSPGVFLILEASALNAKSTFYKNLEKYGVVFAADTIKPKDLETICTQWVEQKIKKENKSISAQSSSFLVRCMGVDYYGLKNEISKLACYIGDRNTITDQDIIALVQAVPQANIWQASEAILLGKTLDAVTICREIIQAGSALIAFIRQIRRQIETDFEVCSLISRGYSTADITKKFPYMKGFILDKHIHNARQYGIERFKSAICTIDSLEFAAKDAAVDDEVLLDLLVIRLTTGIPTPIKIL